jgi:hypothetical protein
VTVSPPPIPRDLTSLSLPGALEIASTTGDGVLTVVDAGGGSTAIASSNGHVFSDRIAMREVADGCIVAGSQPSLDFGNVPVGSSSQSMVCSGDISYQCVGGTLGLAWEIGVAATSNFQVGSRMGVGGSRGDCWTVTFTPQTVGLHTEGLTLLRLGLGPVCQAPFPSTLTVTVTLTGTGT